MQKITHSLIVCHGRAHRKLAAKIITDLDIDYETCTFLDASPETLPDVCARYEAYKPDKTFPNIVLVGAPQSMYRRFPTPKTVYSPENPSGLFPKFFKHTKRLLSPGGRLYLRHPFNAPITFTEEVVKMGFDHLGENTINAGNRESLQCFSPKE